MNHELAKNEASQLAKCEKAIEKGLGTFVEVGQALLDIRDGKLYRASYKTFESYCKERWDISRPRAYQLIEGAKTVQVIAAATGEDLSTAVDKISERHAREMSQDPVGVAAEIVERYTQGEEIADVAQDIAARKRAEKEQERAARKAEQAENDALREQNRQALPDAIKRYEAVKEAAISRKATAVADEIAELREANAALEADVAALKAENELYRGMKVEYEKGGFAEVIAGLGEQIRALKTRVASESQEKVKNLRSLEFWKAEAIKRGYSRNAIIDIETGTEING